jgi:hypothetical protein
MNVPWYEAWQWPLILTALAYIALLAWACKGEPK